MVLLCPSIFCVTVLILIHTVSFLSLSTVLAIDCFLTIHDQQFNSILPFELILKLHIYYQVILVVPSTFRPRLVVYCSKKCIFFKQTLVHRKNTQRLETDISSGPESVAPHHH